MLSLLRWSCSLFQQPYKYKDISFNEEMSQSKSDPINKRIYDKDVNEYGESKSYHIQYDANKNVTLIPNHQPKDAKKTQPTAVTPGTKDYIFVILLKDNKPQLRIGTGSHYFLSNASNTVIAAGTIRFLNNKIEEITDASGGFHVKYDKKINDKDVMSIGEKNSYRHSFKTALTAVGLPIDKFNPFIKLDTGSPSYTRSTEVTP